MDWNTWRRNAGRQAALMQIQKRDPKYGDEVEVWENGQGSHNAAKEESREFAKRINHRR